MDMGTCAHGHIGTCAAVVAYGRMGVWAYGRMHAGVWAYGRMGVRAHACGRVGVWAYGRMGVRAHACGSAGVWAYGYVWAHGHTAARAWMHVPCRTMRRLQCARAALCSLPSQAVFYFCRTLSAGALPSLRHLDLNCNGVENTAVEPISAAISRGAMPSLEVLVGVPSEGARITVSALHRLKMLTTLGARLESTADNAARRSGTAMRGSSLGATEVGRLNLRLKAATTARELAKKRGQEVREQAHDALLRARQQRREANEGIKSSQLRAPTPRLLPA